MIGGGLISRGWYKIFLRVHLHQNYVIIRNLLDSVIRIRGNESCHTRTDLFFQEVSFLRNFIDASLRMNHGTTPEMLPTILNLNNRKTPTEFCAKTHIYAHVHCILCKVGDG